jgi:glutaredoxin 3
VEIRAPIRNFTLRHEVKRFPDNVHLAIDTVKEALMSKVVLFSTSSCSWCRRAKRYFREQRVPFKEVNLERDPAAARDVIRKTGQAGVPVIKIGNRWIVGFDKERIEKELGLQ